MFNPATYEVTAGLEVSKFPLHFLLYFTFIETLYYSGFRIKRHSNSPIVNKTMYESQWGHAVVQFVEALRYKPEGRMCDSLWCHWNFSLTYTFQPHEGTGIDLACKRNNHQ
jgi:hypothetical protein